MDHFGVEIIVDCMTSAFAAHARVIKAPKGRLGMGNHEIIYVNHARMPPFDKISAVACRDANLRSGCVVGPVLSGQCCRARVVGPVIAGPVIVGEIRDISILICTPGHCRRLLLCWSLARRDPAVDIDRLACDVAASRGRQCDDLPHNFDRIADAAQRVTL